PSSHGPSGCGALQLQQTSNPFGTSSPQDGPLHAVFSLRTVARMRPRHSPASCARRWRRVGDTKNLNSVTMESTNRRGIADNYNRHSPPSELLEDFDIMLEHFFRVSISRDFTKLELHFEFCFRQAGEARSVSDSEL